MLLDFGSLFPCRSDEKTLHHISLEDRWMAISMHKLGYSERKIAKQIGRKKGGVHVILNKWKEHHMVEDKKRARKRRKITPDMEENIKQRAEGKVGQSSRRLAKDVLIDTGVKLDHTTYIRLFHYLGLASTPSTKDLQAHNQTEDKTTGMVPIHAGQTSSFLAQDDFRG